MFQRWTYLKTYKRIHETLHTVLKLPLSVDGGDCMAHSRVKPSGHAGLRLMNNIKKITLQHYCLLAYLNLKGELCYGVQRAALHKT